MAKGNSMVKVDFMVKVDPMAKRLLKHAISPWNPSLGSFQNPGHTRAGDHSNHSRPCVLRIVQRALKRLLKKSAESWNPSIASSRTPGYDRAGDCARACRARVIRVVQRALQAVAAPSQRQRAGGARRLGPTLGWIEAAAYPGPVSRGSGLTASPRPRSDPRLRRWLLGLLALVALAPALPLQAASTEALLRLLERRSCPECRLQDADLVHADLRDADLRRAQLQRANLSGARLDGARLEGADLSFTSLQGASLRGADLRGARLEGTDLRSSDLSGALLDPAALSRSHWQGARGIQGGSLGYAELHNAGVEAFRQGRLLEAELFFAAALGKQPQASLSWVARGITRLEQGNKELARQDFRYAASLYQLEGNELVAKQLLEASDAMVAAPQQGKGGNGMGSQILQGALSTFQAIAPLAIKAFAGF